MYTLQPLIRRRYRFVLLVPFLFLAALIIHLFTLPAAAESIQVTSCADSGAGSLREAISTASSGALISFSSDCTITLTTGELSIDRPLTIDGSSRAITLSGDGAWRVFYIESSAAVTLSHLHIISGSSQPFDGGGIYNAGTLVLDQIVLKDNAGEYGGGIYNAGALTITNSTIGNNEAFSGGGLYNTGGAIVTGTQFSNNLAPTGGALTSEGTVTLTQSFITSNASLSWGGAIINTGTFWLSNSTLTDNSAPDEGGALFNAGPLTLTANTLVSNSATIGGGVYNYSSGTLHMRNNLLAANPGGDCYREAGSTTGTNSHNLIADGSCDALLSGDPRLGSLGDYGGETQTYPLLPGSPAIDAGDGAACPATDQRGVSRPAGVGCDIGAFESQGFLLTTTAGDDQNTPVNTIFPYPLALTVSSTGGEPVGPGGVVTFTAPLSGASLLTPTFSVVTSAGGEVSQTVTANGTPGGPYNVTAATTGAAAPALFQLTNDSKPTVVTMQGASAGMLRDRQQLALALACSLAFLTVALLGRRPAARRVESISRE